MFHMFHMFRTYGIILQIFYNYIVSKVDMIVNDMENASISLIDLLVKNEMSNK